MCSTADSTDINSGNFKTLGIHHLGLTVPNIKETARFFIEQMNFTQVGEVPDYPAIFVSDGTVMLTLWQVKDSDDHVAFDRTTNIGLHHFALKVENLKELQNLHERLKSLDDVQIEFSPEQLGDLPIHHMMCFIPGGVRLELICD